MAFSKDLALSVVTLACNGYLRSGAFLLYRVLLPLRRLFVHLPIKRFFPSFEPQRGAQYNAPFPQTRAPQKIKKEFFLQMKLEN
jgi:hypothetical protein